MAARYYPIVFSTDEAPASMAVLGLEAGQNLFVDEAGTWAAGFYIPAYVRRYPFIFMEHDGGTQWTLCVDEAASAVRTDGEASAVTNQALEFCTAFQREATATRALAAALAEAKLLEARTVNFKHDNGTTRQVAGFQIVDEAKFNALADEVVLDWRKRGFLAAIYAQLFSAGAWAGLAARE